MEFHCSTHQPPKPLDPAVDPAYQDGLPPRPRHANHAGETTIHCPVVHMPAALQRQHTISIEVLEAALDREAQREEAPYPARAPATAPRSARPLRSASAD